MVLQARREEFFFRPGPASLTWARPRRGMIVRIDIPLYAALTTAIDLMSYTPPAFGPPLYKQHLALTAGFDFPPIVCSCWNYFVAP